MRTRASSMKVSPDVKLTLNGRFQHEELLHGRHRRYNGFVYSAALIKHFDSPCHAGDLQDANARVRIENPVCGDILELSARIESGTIRAIRFKAQGCVPTMACGSALCHLANGRSTNEAMRLTSADLVHEIGGVPPASMHAVQLALEALHKLLES